MLRKTLKTLTIFIGASAIASILVGAVAQITRAMAGDDGSVVRAVWAAEADEDEGYRVPGAPQVVARLEIYVEGGVLLLTDDETPAGYSLSYCRQRLEEMYQYALENIFPKLQAQGVKEGRVRGVCVDVLEADLDNQTKDS